MPQYFTGSKCNIHESESALTVPGPRVMSTSERLFPLRSWHLESGERWETILQVFVFPPGRLTLLTRRNGQDVTRRGFG